MFDDHAARQEMLGGGQLGGIGHGGGRHAGSGETPWHEFAKAIVEAALPLGIAPLPVLPITTAEYPGAANRPANSCLDCSKLASIFAVRLPHWRDGLKARGFVHKGDTILMLSGHSPAAAATNMLRVHTVS